MVRVLWNAARGSGLKTAGKPAGFQTKPDRAEVLFDNAQTRKSTPAILRTGCHTFTQPTVSRTQERPAMANHAHITGKVEYREGDGQNLTIRPGPVKVQTGVNDVTLSWTDEGVRGAAAIPLMDFQRYVSEGKIRLDD
jgi:hypothetical protein